MFRQMLLNSAVAFAAAHFNTNAGSKLYICATPQAVDLSQAAFEGLTWVQIKGVGSLGETGSQTNILTYDTWDTTVVQKAKGMTNAGDPEIELARDDTDPGQDLLRAAAATNYNYAFKTERNDKKTDAGTPTVIYNRGLVTGPRRPNGRNEDFDLEIFSLGLNQKEVVVDPSGAGVAPQNTVAPSITGTAQVASVLTAANGTWTGDATISYSYLWLANGAAAAGVQGNSTYLPVTADIGKKISVRVTGTNGAGTANGTSPQTAAVIA